MIMVYLLDNDELNVVAFEKINIEEDKQYLCIISFEELESVKSDLDINARTVTECLRFSASKFECHDGFDFITLSIPADIDPQNESQRVCIYLTNKLLLFVCSNQDIINNTIVEIQGEKIKNICIGKIIHLFFDRLTYDDTLVLEKIEQEISDLEEELIVSKKTDLIDYLFAFRKKLLILKRYYEQLLEITEAFEQNENGLIDKKVLRYFRILTNRVNRLYNSVLNLRDYLTHVREAYQAQIDINLNGIMKVFTVITSIFLPLTLIAGWYGMNLKMPEFNWSYGYPFVIVLSIAVAAASLILFKKNKWF